MTTSYELATQYDSRASFYGKARVESDGELGQQLKLISYSTHVATIYPFHKEARVFGTYSQTTLRHIKEFLLQHGFRAESGKQIMADYGG